MGFSSSCIKGTRHDVCQDAVYVKRKDNIWVAALSDGAGSAAKSEYGSKALVQNIADYVILSFDKLLNKLHKNAHDFKKTIVDKALEILETTAKNQSCTEKELSSTLLFVASNGRKAFFFHVGDGVIILRKGSKYSIVSKPYNGEYANETVFINSHDAIETSRAGIINLSRNFSFFLMSDGPEPVFYSKKTEDVFSQNLISYVDDKLIEIEVEKTRNSFLEYVLNERCRPYSADDLSIVVVNYRKQSTRTKHKRKREKKRHRTQKVGP